MNSGPKHLTFVVQAILVLGVLGAIPWDADALGGRDGPRAVVMLHDVYELQNMSMDLNGSYELANDIDASDTVNWNGGLGFQPLGDRGWHRNLSSPVYYRPNSFNGSFDGHGHTISHLYISQAGEDCIGLFGAVGPSGSVSNVTLIDANVLGCNYVGCLVGDNGGKLYNCTVSGYANGSQMVGGLVGGNGIFEAAQTKATITFCRFNGTVGGEHNAIGGLAGENNPGGEISKSYSTGMVMGTSNVGGLVGNNRAHGNATPMGLIINCYSSSKVCAEGHAGGLVGHCNATVMTSYSVGPIIGIGHSGGQMVNVGGLIGGNKSHDKPIITDCYWNNVTSGQVSSVGGTGKDIADMMAKATFINWDFNTTWDVEEGKSYPFLRGLSEPIYPSIGHPPQWSIVPSDTNLTEGEDFTFTASATDVDPGDAITYGIMRAYRLPTGMTMDPSTGVLSWPETVLGGYTLFVIATDGTYTIWHDFYLSINSGTPQPTYNTVIITPVNDSEVSGMVNVTVRVENINYSGRTQLLIDDTLLGYNGTPYLGPQEGCKFFYYLWNSSTVTDGPHKLTVHAQNEFQSDPVHVTVNNTLPVEPPPDEEVPVIRSILGPNNTKVNATESVTFYADVANPGGANLTYEWRENGVTIATGPSLSQKFPAGDHTLVLTVGDGTHYVNQSVSFIVKPKPQAPEPAPVIPGFGTLVAVAAMAGVVAAGLFWRRERRPGNTG